LLARQQGDFTRALDFAQQAVASDPSQAAYFANLGEAHRGLEQGGRAIEAYRQAVRIDPGSPEAHYYLAILLTESNQLDLAITNFVAAVTLRPQFAEAHLRLGAVYQAQNKLAEAQACYQRLVTLEPMLAAGHYQLGNVFRLRENFAEAAVSFRRAIACQTDFPEALCDLAGALKELGQLSEARAHLEEAIRLRPEFVEAHSNLGAVLRDLLLFDEALAAVGRAIELAPERPELHHNRATALKDQGHMAPALASYEQALALDPGYAQALVGRGMALVSMGRFAEGWAGYEHRVRCPQFGTLQFQKPVWDGSPLAGRTLLIHCEQGLGDTLLFVRYVKLARERAASDQIIVAAQPPLIPLLAQSGIAGLVSVDGPLPSFDVHVPLLSLPHVFRIELDAVPHDVPYLKADPGRIEKWRHELARHWGLKVGISWQGRVAYNNDRLRSFPLSHLAPLAAVPGVCLVSLQKGAGSEQLAALGERFPVVDLAPSLDLEGGAFLDTAAAMHSLDLVISCDTAIAHLAGALGTPVWLPLATACYWTWLREREDSVWYPTARLFRQRCFNEWPEVFERMAAELSRLVPRGAG
jgi:tetratricopeptide (TPR) repeat protein